MRCPNLKFSAPPLRALRLGGDVLEPAFGLITVMLHFTAIPLRGFMGHSLVTPLGVPMAFGHIALAVWLIVKGLNDGGQEV